MWGKMRLLGHKHLDELLVVDLAITINVGLADHLIDLRERERERGKREERRREREREKNR